MSLGKLLATGRSLVGGAPDAGRYNISSRNRLPKFGAAKNPFAQPAKAEPQPAASAAGTSLQPAPQPDSETVDQRVAALVRETEKVCQPSGAKLDETQRIPELADQPITQPGAERNFRATAWAIVNRLKAGLQAGAGFAVRSSKKVWQFARGVKWASALTTGRMLAVWSWAKLKTVPGKLTGLFRKAEPKSVFPRLGKPAVQTELSLDTVKVVRNSLEDSDLEIVTAATATGAQVAPTVAAAEPKRGPVPPALKKMTERLLSVKPLEKALD